jgi:hypothetical protein
MRNRFANIDLFTITPTIEGDMTMTTKTTSKLTAIRTILRKAILVPRAHATRVARLEKEDVLALLEECRTGNHRIHPVNLYNLEQRLAEMEEVDWSNRLMQTARTPLENRYDEEHEPIEPRIPVLRRRYRSAYVTLRDGRRARRLDLSRAMPLCGLQAPVVLSEEERHGGTWITGPRQCPRCFGYHLPSPQPENQSPLPRTSVSTQPACPRCKASVVLERMVSGTSESGILERSCLCGWSETTTLLSAEDQAQNELALSRAAVRDHDQEPNLMLGDVAQEFAEVAALGSVEAEDLLFGEVPEADLRDDTESDHTGTASLASDEMSEDEPTEESSDEAASAAEDVSEQEDADDMLIALQNRFWQSLSVKALRCGVLEATILGRLSGKRTDLVWAAASATADSCIRMKEREQREVAQWLVAAPEDVLWKLLPDADLLTEITTEGMQRVLPSVSVKIERWKYSCRVKLARFIYPQAGIRILAPKFGVSQTVFQNACGK